MESNRYQSATAIYGKDDRSTAWKEKLLPIAYSLRFPCMHYHQCKYTKFNASNDEITSNQVLLEQHQMQNQMGALQLHGRHVNQCCQNKQRFYFIIQLEKKSWKKLGCHHPMAKNPTTNLGLFPNSGIKLAERNHSFWPTT